MAASMRPCDYWALTHRRLHSLTKSLLARRAKDAGLDIVTRDGGALRPLPQRSPIRVKKFGSSLLIVDDVAELLQVHRIEIVRADIENPVIDHPEFSVVCEGLAARPGRVGPETQRCQVYVAAQQCVDGIGAPSHLVACLGIALVDALLHQVAQVAREGGQADAIEVGAAAV